MRFEDFLRPVTKAVTAQFNIATAVGRHMTRSGHGVILVMRPGSDPPSRRIPRRLDRTCRTPPPARRRVGTARRARHLAALTRLTRPRRPRNERDEADATPAPGTEGLLRYHQPSYVYSGHP
jgi:hypothetical protein